MSLTESNGTGTIRDNLLNDLVRDPNSVLLPIQETGPPSPYRVKVVLQNARSSNCDILNATEFQS